MPQYSRYLLSVFLILTVLSWPDAMPAPAAPAEAISALFPGQPGGSTSTASGPADGLFATLAAAATTSIDVALYDFDRAQVRDALVAAKGRGLTVRVVGDNDAAADPEDGTFYQSLTAAGIAVVTDAKSSIMHNKFAVFDGQVTWTGSANFSNTAFSRNGENVVVITDTLVADIYRIEFNEMFGGKFSNDKTDNTGHSTTVGGAAVEVAFSPTDGVEQRIVNAVASANTTVQVAMYTFTNQAIAQALIAARTRGVQVEVLLDGTADGSAFSQRDPLCAAGVSLRVETWPGLLHDKYAVVDAGTSSDPLIVTGSTNWTGNAVEANDENLLIVHDTTLASAFAADFARLRGAISPGGFVCNATRTSVYLPLALRPGAPEPPDAATITDIVYDPLDTISEYVVIANRSGAAVEMSGWTLSDLAGNTFSFPSFTLASGATVKVWTKSGTNDSANLYWGRTQAVWNNTGDTAILQDAQGNEVSRYSYP
jgi:phosphatidylserine/phosphatidylglycerophosphate/cardiolipin synthase-like enzyme